MTEPRQHYVYVFLDPKRPGEYRYGEYEFGYEPRYVGKGIGNRDTAHLTTGELRSSTTPLTQWIKESRKGGYEPVILRFAVKLTDKKASLLEKSMIEVIGRQNTKSGPLLNVRPGAGVAVEYQSTTVRPRTIRLSAEGDEALLRLSDGLFKSNMSATVDWLAKEEMERRGYVVAPEEELEQMRMHIICDGKQMPIIQHKGDLFIPAIKDKEYQIRLVNSSPHRRLAVLSVDGVNIINGKDAGYDGPGFRVDPYSRFLITGFMRSNEEAAAFRFNTLGKSYAAKTGRGKDNVGVIGLAVFDEKPKPEPYWRRRVTTEYVSGDPSLYSASGIKVLDTEEAIRMRPEMYGFTREQADNNTPEFVSFVETTMTDGGLKAGGYSGGEPSGVYFTNTAHDGVATMDFMSQETEIKTSGLTPPVLERVVRTDASSKRREEMSTGGKRKRSKGKKGGQSGVLRARSGGTRPPPPKDWGEPMKKDMGTEYGRKVTMRTQDCEFERATEKPAEVLQYRYASAAVLESWGVPIGNHPPSKPEAFPAEQAMVPPPSDWRG